jgi:hypothetical protein
MLETQTVNTKTKYIPVPAQDDLPYDDARFRHHSIPPLPTQDDLPSCDGAPMETERHRLQMEILINSLKPWLGERGYVSGNMFMYFSAKHLKNQDFRGPDVFVVRDVPIKNAGEAFTKRLMPCGYVGRRLMTIYCYCPKKPKHNGLMLPNNGPSV